MCTDKHSKAWLKYGITQSAVMRFLQMQNWREAGMTQDSLAATGDMLTTSQRICP